MSTIKITKQRQRILELIMTSDGHMTADQVHSKLKEEDDKIGIATVYRNLNILYKNHQINRVLHPEYGYIYDRNLNEHYHFHCKQCNRVFDLEMTYKNGLNDLIARSMGAEIFSHTLLFEGICKECLEKNNAAKKRHSS